MDLTTLAAVKEWGAPISGSGEDALLGTIITAVSGTVERYLRRHVEQISRTEYMDVEPGQFRFYLKGYPITSVTSVKNDSDWDFASTDAIATTEFTTKGSELTGRLLVDDSITLVVGASALEVIYTGGMAANTAAFITAFPDVSLATSQQVYYEFQKRKQMGSVSSAVGGHNVSFESPVDLLPAVKRKLNPYRNMRRQVSST